MTNLYEGFLQRGPDAGGLGFWSGQATVGTGRQNVLNAFATSGGFYELAGTLYREAFWLVSDRLGTPRMIASKSGTLASVKRHDYLPFGEELYAGMSGRTTTQGYTGDSTRQHFTGYEADAETGLNFAEARYQSSLQGRFTSVDPLGASASVTNPQSVNRYSYVNNNPTNLTDPSGMMAYGAEHSYSDVAEGFWGRSVDLNRSHFGGPAILYAAGLLQNIAVEGGIQERNHAASSSRSYKPNWLTRGLNAAIDRRMGFSFANGGEGGIDVSVSAEVTGIEPGQGKQSMPPFPNDLAKNLMIFLLVLSGNGTSANEAAAAGADDVIIICQAYKESRFIFGSQAGSHRGFLQMGPTAATDIGLSRDEYEKAMSDPVQSVRISTRYLAKRINDAGGDLKQGLNGYGTGPGYADNIYKCADAFRTAKTATDFYKSFLIIGKP